ncbi:MAG TPA: Asp-tRNA(Asn)/Glu-tRNA(Gln) amidotransferase GatCAB subunit B, partial [Alphaproteobacteria bacterium]|nr:Asp-tRNA(Asn)/Glu-tRNA(Gln) amidotransferase GatCAB subunit B [Alphaproteobacteria bacterium]
RFVQQAIEYESRRQVDLIEAGGAVAQQTRLFDSKRGETREMRSKEEAHDYRYFPDPDLLPLELEPAWVEGIKASLPELPDAKKARFVKAYGLGAYDASVLVADRASAAYFDAVAKGRDGKQAANWVSSELFGRLNKAGKGIEDSPVSPEALGGLIDLIADNTISGRIAKDVFDEMFETGKSAAAIVEAKGLRQITDTGAIEAAIAKVIADNPGQVEQYKGGKQGVVGWLVGQVMKATGGKANPKLVNELLRKALEG